ncbi:MAG: hypothetical protein WD827_01830 [Solirubrobacterales bacterium]
MTTKIAFRGIIASLAFASALIMGGTALAPAASAELPPPFPIGEELPAPPTEGEAPTTPPPADSSGVVGPPVAVEPSTQARVLRARMAGKKLALSLECSSAGTVKLSGGAARRFSCADGKATAALKLSAAQRKRGNSAKGLRIAVLLHTGGDTIRVPLTIGGSSDSNTASTSAGVYWDYTKGQCTSYGAGRGGLARIETDSRNGFGIAAAGETIYWKAVLWAYINGSWKTYPYGSWESYPVNSTMGYTVTQTFTIPANMWTITKVYAWTARAGYRSMWVNNNGGGYGNVYSKDGYCRTY